MASPAEAMVRQIAALKAERGAVILAHNYQEAEVQDVADFVGDSLELSRKAAAVDAATIVFCGVYFMAETAAILCPDKTVWLPDLEAGCPMVDMAPLEDVLALQRAHPGAITVTYVNSSAAVKAVSDVCCTSANAVGVVEALPRDREILFVPDQYLGAYVAERTGRKLTLYPGYCPTHARLTARAVAEARRRHPEAEVLVHPECRREVTALADAVLSTGGMCRHVRASAAPAFVIGTEVGLLHRLAAENPGKRLYALSDDVVCPNMKRIRLEHVLASLRDGVHRVRVPEDVRVAALRAVERMIAVAA